MLGEIKGEIMKQIERITPDLVYQWWRVDGDDIDNAQHVYALEKTAENHIASMMLEGFTSGDLSDVICIAEDDMGGVDYRGHWKVINPVHKAQIDKVEQIDKMVDRFLRWRLPDDFAPDCGVSFTPIHKDCWPVGTNLLTATQARDMIKYILESN